jgi:phage anti-repressor protein
MRQANIINAILDEETRNLKFIENFDKLQTNVLQLRGIGELDMAKDLVMRVYREICLMPDEPDHEARWKVKYLGKFEQMFKDTIDYDDVKHQG